LGTTQRGKTSAIKTLAAQLRYNRDTAVVAHDSNDDYTQYFADQLGTEVLSLNRDGGDVKWNLFREVPENATEAEAEMLFESIARGLIPQSEKSQPYFIDSARNIFVGLCMILWTSKENPDHADLYSIIFDLDPESDYESKGEQVKQLLKDNGHPTAAEGIKPGEKGDTYSTLTTQLKKQLKGDFRKSGKFSFREYYENPGGSVVSVESPESLNTCKEMYGVLLDRASQTALDISTSSYFVLDEIGKLGVISSLDDLAARGLKQRSRLIVGVQSVDAMLKVYNEDLAQTILGNMTQMISFESKTSKTTQYIQDRLGKRTEIQQSRSVGGGSLGESRTESEVRRAPIESSVIESMPQGVGIVSGPNDWWYLRWMHPDEAVPMMAESRGSVTNEHETEQQRQQQQQQQQQADVAGWDDLDDRSSGDGWSDV
jgi:type IV secretory pathway TraG/TraD family ATPase VirD4